MATNAWRYLLKTGFGLLYNQMAWSYDLVSWVVSRGEWRAWQQAGVPHVRGQLVLELAHGPGHMLLALQAAGFQVVGLDLSSSMSRLANRRTRHARDRIALVRGDGRSLPFCTCSFDTVFSTFPTEFLAQAETIAGVYRILRPGGRLVVVPQARLSGGSALTRFIEWLYAITGQRPGASTEEREGFWQMINSRFEQVGFVLRTEQVRQQNSEVTVVVAEKPRAGE